MGEDGTAVDVDLVADRDVVAEHSHVLQTCPLADTAVPADDGRFDPGVVLDAAVLQDNASLETHTVANDNIGTDGDIGADAAVLANLRRWVDQDVSAVDVRFGGGCEELRAGAGQGREVEAGARQEVLGLAHVHPEALQVERVQLTVLDKRRERLLLDGGGSELNAREHRGVENVDTGIDAVADKLDGLLDEAVYPRGVVGLVHNDTVLGRLLHLGDNNGTLVAVRLVELGELLEGVFASDVGVEDEEGRVVLAQNALGELQRAGGT